VHMRVLETRHEHPAPQVDDLGARTDELAHGALARRDDPVTAHRDGVGARPHGRRGEDGSADEGEADVGHGSSRAQGCGWVQPPAMVRRSSGDTSPAGRSTGATTARAMRVSTSMMVDTAAISGRRPPRNAESTYTGHGVAPGTCTNDETIVLSRLKVNDSSSPASTAGIASGRVIARKVRIGGA